MDGRTLSADCTSFYEGRKKNTPKLNSLEAPTVNCLPKKKTKKNGFLFEILVCIGHFSGGKFPLFLHFSGGFPRFRIANPRCACSGHQLVQRWLDCCHLGVLPTGSENEPKMFFKEKNMKTYKQTIDYRWLWMIYIDLLYWIESQYYFVTNPFERQHP